MNTIIKIILALFTIITMFAIRNYITNGRKYTAMIQHHTDKLLPPNFDSQPIDDPVMRPAYVHLFDSVLQNVRPF